MVDGETSGLVGEVSLSVSLPVEEDVTAEEMESDDPLVGLFETQKKRKTTTSRVKSVTLKLCGVRKSRGKKQHTG
jgi:hypothetical protein